MAPCAFSFSVIFLGFGIFEYIYMSISSKVLGDKDTSLHLDQIYFLKKTRVNGVIKKNTTHELN
jgi:hypothetical protein